jgi:hypothetical protein
MAPRGPDPRPGKAQHRPPRLKKLPTMTDDGNFSQGAERGQAEQAKAELDTSQSRQDLDPYNPNYGSTVASPGKSVIGRRHKLDEQSSPSTRTNTFQA